MPNPPDIGTSNNFDCGDPQPCEICGKQIEGSSGWIAFDKDNTWHKVCFEHRDTRAYEEWKHKLTNGV
jgi:hypothetical protein